jgi:hypothetical protein
VKTPKGVKWITVPVSGGIHQRICDAKIDYSQDMEKKHNWRENHLSTIYEFYSSAPYYESYNKDILNLYSYQFSTISELNINFLKQISQILGIETKFVTSMDLNPQGIKEEKVINICHKIGADKYISGPAGKNYIDERKFKSENINLQYKDYSGYPQYQQLWGDFEHAVSIIDVIFNCGDKAPDYIWKWRDNKKTC